MSIVLFLLVNFGEGVFLVVEIGMYCWTGLELDKKPGHSCFPCFPTTVALLSTFSNHLYYFSLHELLLLLVSYISTYFPRETKLTLQSRTNCHEFEY